MDKIKQEVMKFLEERAHMIKDGFPYCYSENAVQLHCNSCRKNWKLMQRIECEYGEHV